jgi:hypothetical protein
MQCAISIDVHFSQQEDARKPTASASMSRRSQYQGELTPWSTVLLVKLIVTQLVKNFPAFYGTQSFTIVFTRAHH